MATLDDILGPAPSSDEAQIDDILGPAPAPEPASPVHDEWFKTSAPGRVLDAFGQGAKSGWGSEPLGLSNETAAFLRKAGVFNDYSQGRGNIIRAFNEAVMRPAAIGAEAVTRGLSAVFRGAQSAVVEAAHETGNASAERLARDVVSIPEAFQGAPEMLRAPAPTPDAIADLVKPTEAEWKGTAPSPPVAPVAEQAALDAIKNETEQPSPLPTATPVAVETPEAAPARMAAEMEPPEQIFSEPASTDKAGNIRLDLLNTPQDVNQVLRDTAAANNDFLDQRRGVISDGQVLDLANALGMDAADLSKRKLGQAFNAEQITAARKLLVQSATNVRDLMAKAADGSDADVMAYAEAKARHQMIQGEVSGITAEAGRALRAFRAFDGSDETQVLGDFLENATGKTLDDLRNEAKLGNMLETPEQVSKFIADSDKPNFADQVLEYWINALISGPATHTTYSIGNALLALWKAVPETAVASAIGKARQLAGSAEPRVMPGEVGAGLYGLVKGVPDGMSAGWQALKSGMTTPLPGEGAVDFALQQGRGAIPGALGTVVRVPSRLVATIHSFFRAVGYSQAKAALAYRQAAEEGLTGDAFAQRVADLSTDPTPEIMSAARAEATDQTLMGRGGDFTQTLAQLSKKDILGVPLLRFVMPFVKIGSNIMSQGLLERTPLGFLDPEIRANLRGKNGAVARDTALARVAVGTALGTTAFGLASRGFLTGGGPSDPKEAAVWRLAGNQPYSVRIGDTWYAAHRLGPLALVLGIAADAWELRHALDGGQADKIGGMIVGAVTKGLLDETWMRGPSELVQVLEDADRYGPRYVRDELSSFVPFSVGMSQVARAADPYSRQARSIVDAVRNKIPWLSTTLLPRRDIWGEPIPNKDALGPDGLSAIYEARVNHDPVNLELEKLGVFPAQPERKIRGVELTDRQYDDYSRVAGRMAKMRLNALVSMPGFDAIPLPMRRELVTKTIGQAREAARVLVMMQNLGIAQAAIAQKQARLGQ